MNMERRGKELPKIMIALVYSMELLPSLPFLSRESQIVTDILQVASRKTSLTLFDFFEIPCSFRFS